jgi:hypothetical protein
MILSADRGISQVNQLALQPEPRFANHGSFSLPVNYHALGIYVKQQGGLALTCQRRDTGLVLCTLLLNNEPSAHAQNGTSATVDAFNKHFREFNPDDAYSVKRALEKVGQQLTPDQMLAHLRLSRWDYRILNLFFPSLLDYCRYFDPSERLQWITALLNTWENYYPLGDKIDPCFQMGVMAMELGAWGLGKDCFKAAVRYHGKAFGSLYNLALCSSELGEFELAEKFLLQAQTIIESQIGELEQDTERKVCNDSYEDR